MFSRIAVNENAHEQGIWTLKWHQQHLLTGGADGIVKVFDSQLEEINSFKHHSLSVINIDTYHNKAISNSFDGTLCLFDINTGHIDATMEYPAIDCFNSKLSQSLIARTSHDGSIYIMDYKGKPLYTLQAKKDVFVFSCCFNNDGTKLAAGLHDGSIAIFDIETQKLLHSINTHSEPIRQVQISPDGQFLISASYDKRVGIIDLYFVFI